MILYTLRKISLNKNYINGSAWNTRTLLFGIELKDPLRIVDEALVEFPDSFPHGFVVSSVCIDRAATETSWLTLPTLYLVKQGLLTVAKRFRTHFEF